MAGNVLDFEKPIAQLEERIAQVKRLTREEGMDRSGEIAVLESHVQRLMREILVVVTQSFSCGAEHVGRAGVEHAQARPDPQVAERGDPPLFDDRVTRFVRRTHGVTMIPGLAAIMRAVYTLRRDCRQAQDQRAGDALASPV